MAFGTGYLSNKHKLWINSQMSDLSSASEYHHRTKYRRGRMPGSSLDQSNQPGSTKIYEKALSSPLPKELILPRIEAARALLGGFQRKPEPLSPDLLARLLYMSYGYTAQVDYQTEVFYYRSAPSAGALYPVEVYLTARGIEGLIDGLYHYNLGDFALNILRQGTPPSEIPAPAIFLSTVFFRSAWKYRERAFRYCLLDTGHVAENISIISPTLGLGTRFEADFDDLALNNYLGLKPEKEAVLGIINLEKAAEEATAECLENLPKPPTAGPAAAREIPFDLITQIWERTLQRTAESPSDVPAWPENSVVSLPAPDRDDFRGSTLVEALQNRRSRRNFKPKDIQPGDLSRLLSLVVTPEIINLINLNLVTNAVQGLKDGCYHYQPSNHSLKKNAGGFMGLELSNTALNQDWLGRANLVLAVSAPLERLERSIGPRALRLAYLAAGRLGQRAYLAAEAMDWGCCGVGAFFDDEVREVLNLPQGEEVLYLIPVGPIKKRTHGGRPVSR